MVPSQQPTRFAHHISDSTLKAVEGNARMDLCRGRTEHNERT
jgi:hypothetical protein